MAKTVLFIYNDPLAPEAMLGDAFSECGYDVQTFEAVPLAQATDPRFDVDFPDPRDYDAIVPLGARYSVNDGDRGLQWIGSEIAMVRDAHAAGVPMLGVCFGGQLLARALGGTVVRSPAPEVGWFEIDSSRTDLIPAGPWFEWHFDRFSIPDRAVEIARNGSASQAFILGRTLGIQFHPEVNGELLEKWLGGDGAAELADVGVTAEDLRRATSDEVDSAAKRVRALVGAFVDTVAARDA